MPVLDLWCHDFCYMTWICNSLDLPMPAGPHPGMLLAGSKPQGVIQWLFPSNVATMLPMAQPCRGSGRVAPPKGRTMGNVHFFARLACSALLISGRRRTSISRSPILSISSPSPARASMLYGCSTLFPISCSSIRPSAFHHSDFSPQAAASCLNPCSMVAQRERFLTLASCIRPFPCSPPSQPSYTFRPPHHGLPISMQLGRTTHAVPDICSSVCPFTFRQLSSPSYDLVPRRCSLFSMLLGCTSHAVPYISSSLRPFAFRQLYHFPRSCMISKTYDIICLWYHIKYDVKSVLISYMISYMISYSCQGIYDIKNLWYHSSIIHSS